MGTSSEVKTEVELPIDPFDRRRGFEYVPALKITENRYRLIASPGFAAGVASGDEIELDSHESLGYRVVKRGGNICVQVFLRTCTTEDRERLSHMAKSIAGWVDGGMDRQDAHLLIFTFPLATGFRAIEDMMERVSLDFPVDKWMYGNVYDAKDGVTPLNWWLE